MTAREAAIDKLPQHEKKRKKPANLKGRSLKWCLEQGYVAADVEKFNSFTKRRHDFLGFADILAVVPPATMPDLSTMFERVVDPGRYVLAIQVTSDGDHRGGGGAIAEHIRKIAAEPRARKWLEAGQKIVVHGWGKKGKAGTRKLWTLREVPVTLADLTTEKPEWSPF